MEELDIFVYADWKGLTEPNFIGILTAQQGKGRRSFSFVYDKHWLNSQPQTLLDPEIGWYDGHQYPDQKVNFGVFLDSMPDTWGRTLMQRRASSITKITGGAPRLLNEIDFLLGVQDIGRMGALRFKTNPEHDFLANDPEFPTPPITRLRELQYGIKLIESKKDTPHLDVSSM